MYIYIVMHVQLQLFLILISNTDTFVSKVAFTFFIVYAFIAYVLRCLAVLVLSR